MITDHMDYHFWPIPYYVPWKRAQPYLLGLLVGYALYKTRGIQLNINPVINTLLWQASFLLAFAIVYGNPTHNLGDDATDVSKIIYQGLMRLVWPLSLCWPIFSCVRGYGGIVNDFLSWEGFLPLARLTYIAYLIHLDIVIPAMGYNILTTVDLSLWLETGLFLSALVFTMALAFFLSLAFEAPFIKLEKLVFGILLGTGNRSKETKPTVTTSTKKGNK